MKIWIVKGAQGLYDDYHTYDVKGFMSEEAAKAWISTQPEVNMKALGELQQITDEYYSKIVPPSNDATDEEWEKFQTLVEKSEIKALKEIQAIYPNDDLSIDIDFHGYHIKELEVLE